MHQRGWTTFKVHGRLGNKRVMGYGQLPFTASQAQEHEPWLVLEMGTSLTYQDTPEGAQIRDAQNRIQARYPGGSFFAGLGRPWAGLHALDTVRRDAAASGYSFTTEVGPETDKVRVQVDAKPFGLIYHIDLDDDRVDSVEFFKSGQSIGLWEFEYEQAVESRSLRFSRVNQTAQSGKMPGMNWLFREINREADRAVNP